MSLDKTIINSDGNTLDTMVQEWARHTVERLKKEIDQRGMSVTNELIESLTYRVESGQNPGIVISFRNYGAFRDMKFLFFSKMPPVDKLEQWVSKRGISQFAYVPGFGQEGLNRPDAAARIAWGIAKNFASGERLNNWARGKKQRSQWQQPAIGKAIAHLSHLLSENIADQAAKEIVKPLLRR